MNTIIFVCIECIFVKTVRCRNLGTLFVDSSAMPSRNTLQDMREIVDMTMREYQMSGKTRWKSCHHDTTEMRTVNPRLI